MYFFQKILLFLLNVNFLLCSGGFDHGTVVGKGKIQIDLTINPFNLIPFGQSYIVVSYGLADKIDIHGYFSHHANGVDQYYYGIMHQFLNKNKLDLSTALGFRNSFDVEELDLFFPQLLYTIKKDKFNLGGSIVSVQDLMTGRFSGITYECSVFLLLDNIKSKFKCFEKVELGLGIFRNLGNNIYPVYSIDIIF